MDAGALHRRRRRHPEAGGDQPAAELAAELEGEEGLELARLDDVHRVSGLAGVEELRAGLTLDGTEPGAEALERRLRQVAEEGDGPHRRQLHRTSSPWSRPGAPSAAAGGRG